MLAILTASSNNPPGLFLKSKMIWRMPCLCALMIADLSSPEVLLWNLLIVSTPTLPFFSYSTLLTWMVSRLILISFSCEPRFIVKVTYVPFLPRTILTTWSSGLPTTEWWFTCVTISLGWIPAFSAGESFIGLVTLICSFFFCISAPMPTKSPDTPSLNCFVSSAVIYSEYGSLSSLTIPSMADWVNLSELCFL